MPGRKQPRRRLWQVLRDQQRKKARRPGKGRGAVRFGRKGPGQ